MAGRKIPGRFLRNDVVLHVGRRGKHQRLENRTTLKISRKLIFALLCCYIAFSARARCDGGQEDPWSFSAKRRRPARRKARQASAARKSNNPKNLAKVDLRTSLLLYRFQRQGKVRWRAGRSLVVFCETTSSCTSEGAASISGSKIEQP